MKPLLVDVECPSFVWTRLNRGVATLCVFLFKKIRTRYWLHCAGRVERPQCCLDREGAVI